MSLKQKKTSQFFHLSWKRAFQYLFLSQFWLSLFFFLKNIKLNLVLVAKNKKNIKKYQEYNKNCKNILSKKNMYETKQHFIKKK